METPINKAIGIFEDLKSKAQNLKDVVYLDGVLAVLDSIKPYEKEVIEQTHMQGQKDAGVDPSAYNAMIFFEKELDKI